MASAYPLEIVQVARWLQANKDLKGDQLAKGSALDIPLPLSLREGGE